MKTIVKKLFTGIALVAATLHSAGGAPGVAVVGQVGNASGNTEVPVLIMIKGIDGGKVADAHILYHKLGTAAAPGTYSPVSIANKTADVLTIQSLLNQAAAAGYDLSKLDAVLPGAGTLEERLAAVLVAQSKDGSAEARRELLAATHIPVAMAMGHAFIATVPATSVSTFEVRRYHIATSTEGKVVGRVTTPTSPEFLPAPSHLTDVSGDTMKDHFRAKMVWAQPFALRQKALHWPGFNVYCAPRQEWRDAFGQDPPANISRANLLSALASGHAVQVNDLPVLPGEDVPAPPPADVDPYFIHDFPQGQEPEDGKEFMYWVCASDYFCRPGRPSGGIFIRFCDRKPPATPQRLRASRAHTYKLNGTGGSFIQLKWKGDPVGEVARYFVYASDRHDDGLLDMRTDEFDPLSAHHIATIDNIGDAVMKFPANNDPIAALMPAGGSTRYFWLRAEDNAVCKKSGYGNLSGVSGAVPAFLPIISVPGRPSGRLVTTCCYINGSVSTQREHDNNDEVVTLRATRTTNYFRSVEFVAFVDGGNAHIPFGIHHFEPGLNVLQTEANLVGAGTVRMAARYRTQTGRVTPWIEGPEYSTPPGNEIHTWAPAIDCITQAAPRGSGACPAGSVNPGDGSVLPVCLEFSASPGVTNWIAYKRVGRTGALTKFESGKFDGNGDAVAKDFNSPVHGGLVCYFLQFFDDDGNASVMAQVGCVEREPKEPLPRASIAGSARATDIDPGADPGEQDITAFCPRDVVERLQWKICPAPAGATLVEQEAFLGEDGIVRFATCGFIDSERFAAGYGGTGSEFVQRFGLAQGIQYRVRVRAVGKGDPATRPTGDWSAEHIITWPLGNEVAGPKVKWPAREVPPVGAQPVDSIFDEQDEMLLVKIGTIQATSLPVDDVGDHVVVGIELLDDHLFLKPPFVVYLRPEGPNASGKELQVTHYIQKFLVQPAGQGFIQVDDLTLAIKQDPGDPTPFYHIWVRVHQPVIKGRAYSCSIVRHGEDREPIETLRTNVVTVPVN